MISDYLKNFHYNFNHKLNDISPNFRFKIAIFKKKYFLLSRLNQRFYYETKAKKYRFKLIY